MIIFFKAQIGRLSCVSLITFFLGQSLAGYQQGSYFLFDFSATAPEKAVAGRIAVSLSDIKSISAKTKPAPSPKPKLSEFQTEITSLQSADKGTQLLKGGAPVAEKGEPQIESKFSESSFGDGQAAPSGFFFTY